MVRASRDEITIGTEHWRSDEWKEKGRVAGAKLKPDLVWLRGVPGGDWVKVVVDVKVTSTEDLSKAFKEKDDKCREWTIRETREKKVVKAVRDNAKNAHYFVGNGQKCRWHPLSVDVFLEQ